MQRIGCRDFESSAEKHDNGIFNGGVFQNVTPTLDRWMECLQPPALGPCWEAGGHVDLQSAQIASTSFKWKVPGAQVAFRCPQILRVGHQGLVQTKKVKGFSKLLWSYSF